MSVIVRKSSLARYPSRKNWAYDVALVQFLGKVQQKRALREHDEVRETIGILLDLDGFVFCNMHDVTSLRF
jgi:hypothetical protein